MSYNISHWVSTTDGNILFWYTLSNIYLSKILQKAHCIYIPTLFCFQSKYAWLHPLHLSTGHITHQYEPHINVITRRTKFKVSNLQQIYLQKGMVPQIRVYNMWSQDLILKSILLLSFDCSKIWITSKIYINHTPCLSISLYLSIYLSLTGLRRPTSYSILVGGVTYP